MQDNQIFFSFLSKKTFLENKEGENIFTPHPDLTLADLGIQVGRAHSCCCKKLAKKKDGRQNMSSRFHVSFLLSSTELVDQLLLSHYST